MTAFSCDIQKADLQYQRNEETFAMQKIQEVLLRAATFNCNIYVQEGSKYRFRYKERETLSVC